MSTDVTIDFPGEVLPVHNCIKVCIEPTDVISEAGTYAEIVLTFTNTASVNGESFVIAGETFYVDSTASGSGSLVDLTDSSGLAQAVNMKSALDAHPAFPVSMVLALNVLTITWLEAKEVFAWTFDFSGLTGPPTLGAMNGSRVIVLAKIGYHWLEAGLPITDLSSVPIITTDVDATTYCFNAQRELMPLVSTQLPELTDAIVSDDVITKLVQIRHGLLDVPEDGCGVVYKNFQNSDEYLLLNQQLTADQLLDYGIYHEPSIRLSYLTSKPSGSTICIDEVDWLWLVLMTENPVSNQIRYRFYNAAGIPVHASNIAVAGDKVFIIPSGRNIDNVIVGVPWSVVSYYTIQPYLVMPATTYLAQLYKYKLRQKCCDTFSLYFLDPLGGYTLLPCSELEEQAIITDGDEICKSVICGYTLLTNYKVRERYVITIKLFPTEANIKLLAAYKASNVSMILKDGILTQCFKEPDGTAIFQKSSILLLTTVIFISTERFTQIQ